MPQTDSVPQGYVGDGRSKSVGIEVQIARVASGRAAVGHVGEPQRRRRRRAEIEADALPVVRPGRLPGREADSARRGSVRHQLAEPSVSDEKPAIGREA